MIPDDLENHMLGTYFSLRKGLAVIALLFPLLLSMGGRFYAGIPLQDSISAYYHAAADGKSMRDWFIGILFAVGALLYLYKGYSRTENITLNIAGLFAWGIALFPMEWKNGSGAKFSLHGFCAISFFICIAVVCIRCASDTLYLLPDETLRRFFRHVYRWLGVLMMVLPALAYVSSVFIKELHAVTFLVETVGILVFAAYWSTKSEELARTKAERKAVRGQLKI